MCGIIGLIDPNQKVRYDISDLNQMQNHRGPDERGVYKKSIEGFQRYPISNHFNWLLNGQPSGHKMFDNLNNDDFHKHYEKLLDNIDQTDTLIGYFSKNI